MHNIRVKLYSIQNRYLNTKFKLYYIYIYIYTQLRRYTYDNILCIKLYFYTFTVQKKKSF